MIADVLAQIQKLERRLDDVSNRVQTILDEGFGPEPVDTLENNLDLLEMKISQSKQVTSAMHEDQVNLLQENQKLREEKEEDRKRILQLLIERDRYQFEAEQKWAMRRELEELLGIDNGAPGDEQFKKGLKRLKELVAENKKLKCKRK